MPARSAAPCRCSMCSWRARARPSRASRRSRSTTRGLRISPTKIPGRTRVRGARIIFAGADGVEKTLYYFSTDLSNSGVKASGFLKFCSTLAPGNSLIKSASYLLHSGNFTTVRDFILANSATIIQDDSGIPLALLQPEEMAVLSVRPLRRSDRRIPGTISGVLCRAVQARASRWISASAIAGARMNRICCCRSGCRTTARQALRRRHRPSHRHGRHVRKSRDRRRTSGRSRGAASSSGAELHASPAHALARLDEGRGALAVRRRLSKYRQAATMTMRRASTASRSICRRS